MNHGPLLRQRVARLRLRLWCGGAILGGIAGSGLCKYGLQRYLAPLRQTFQPDQPAQYTT